MTAPLPFQRSVGVEKSPTEPTPTCSALSASAAAKHTLNKTSQRLILECSPVMAIDALQVLMVNIVELSQLKDEAERTITHTNAFGITTKFILRKNVTGFSIKAKT